MVTDRWRFCAFCHLIGADLIYYALRHYACGTCVVNKLPLPRLLALKTHPLGQLPVLALDAHGYLEAVGAELARRRSA